MKINDVRKIIISLMLIAFLWVIYLVDFISLGVKNTIFYSLTEKVADNSIIIIFLLVFSGIIGLFYKNGWSFYSMFINAEMVLCYLVLTSMIITNTYYIDEKCIALFSTFFLCLYCLCNAITEKKNEFKQGELEPITKFEELYEDRYYQADIIKRIIIEEDSEFGYSVCISAKWGEGKTSFINSILNKLIQEGNEGFIDVSLYEIRINAMELDNLSSLIYYFFGRVKDILKNNGVYVGVKSEYQELIGSLINNIANETIGDYIKKGFLYDTDYRENLINLNNLINTHLKQKRIIIVVDDLDRCTQEKIMEFLFFIKEIAMLNRCVVFFLVDYEELKEKLELKDEYLEKFFNYKMTLRSVSYNEIIKKTIKDKHFFALLKDCETIYLNEIEKAKKDKYLYIQDYDKRAEYKQKSITAKEENYNHFCVDTKNPRELIKVYKKYRELIKIAEGTQYNTMDQYKKFLDKLDYKRQIFILSLIYGFNKNQYECIESQGIGAYLDFIDPIYKTRIISVGTFDDCEIDDLAYNEWTKNKNDYIIKEKIRFVSLLISSPNEIYKAANSFTTLQEQYLFQIRHKEKPENSGLVEVLKEIVTAKFHSNEEEAELVTGAMILFKDDMNFDEAISVLCSKELIHYIQDDDYILDSFYKAYKDLECEKKDECYNEFITFAERYLYNNLRYISRFVAFLIKDIDTIKSLEEIVFNKKSSSDMICMYYRRVSKELIWKIGGNPKDPIACLKALCGIASSYCRKEKILTCNDVIGFFDDAKRMIERVKSLLEIEQCILLKTCSKTVQVTDGDNYYEKLCNLIEFVTNCDEHKLCLSFDSINGLINKMAYSNESVSENEIVKLNQLIELYYERIKQPNVNWRRLYIKIKEKVNGVKSQCKENGSLILNG